MATPEDVQTELTGGDTFDLFANRPKPYGGVERTGRLKRIAHAAAFEVTLYLPRRGLRNMAQAARRTDTNTGHSVVAASYGAANHALLVAIGLKVGVDVPAVLAPYVDDPTVEDPA